jgi:glycosidase
MFEFHISKKARDKYGFDDTLFSSSGNVIFANIKGVRLLSARINKMRYESGEKPPSMSAGDLYAMGLIDEALHQVVDLYRQYVNSDSINGAFALTVSRAGESNVEKCLEAFMEEFPPVDVYKGKCSISDYLKASTDGIPNAHIALQEMLLLSLANNNPAFAPFMEFFDDRGLKNTAYIKIISMIEEYFKSQPVFGPFGNHLVDMLREPQMASPYSLYGQLEYIKTHWGEMLKDLLVRVLGGIDLIKEERKNRFSGPGPTQVLTLDDLSGASGAGLKTTGLDEIERFTPDTEWMPRLVLMAKSTYVWLSQLSVKYGRNITRIDEIPDEELERLSCWGFTGLWLIGIWERSSASKKIKRMTGNPEAEASAYSIYDYQVAADLGGEEACQKLKERAAGYGIRLATDMVPNHMGIYSRWVIEHPEWFIQLNYPPFPGYSFTGANLSDDDRVELYLEDGYWSRTDAAVVFKRVDRYTGDVRYIYHGNDGTHMPWNDTAQLDHLKDEVRQAVINITLDVARRFSVIRFDAAMTLAKKHFQRLWYPVPGMGGDIPSRAGLGLANDEFNRLFPKEFWRELVDRFAVEAPNTLLLAEAFWLMEGYFVRSLGMHRVYNSAFMNMLKKEENSKYRDVIKNVLKFNPEILRRFVNFMNNPDEESAVVQFGKDDKYFGIALLMVTMPGLPMFGHGQIEGFSEKYGMEYRRAYWDEHVDSDLVRRHEAEIFPLMKKRHLFSGVDNFVLYDVVSPNGWVNEDVFAYSNMAGDERTLIIYNNRYAEARGYVRRSVGINIDTGGKRNIVHRSLAEGLKIKNHPNIFYIFRDHRNSMEYIRSGKEISDNGLSVQLGAFQSNIFLDFREVHDTPDGLYSRLEKYLAGRGVPDVNTIFKELYLENIHAAFRDLIGHENLKRLAGASGKALSRELEHFQGRLELLIMEIRKVSAVMEGAADKVLERTLIKVRLVLESRKLIQGGAFIEKMPNCSESGVLNFAITWAAIHNLGALFTEESPGRRTKELIDEMLLSGIIREMLSKCDECTLDGGHAVELVRILCSEDDRKPADPPDIPGITVELIGDADVRSLLGINNYNGIEWFNKETFEMLTAWLLYINRLKKMEKKPDAKKIYTEFSDTLDKLVEAGAESSYRLDWLIMMLSESFGDTGDEK